MTTPADEFEAAMRQYLSDRMNALGEELTHAQVAEWARQHTLNGPEVRGLVEALQQMIILYNGEVPGKLDAQVFDEAIAARDAYEAAREGGR
jgi:hypothetical protein